MPLLRDLNVSIEGAGPTLVLAPGFGTTQETWRRVRPWLLERYRVVSFDLACSGAVDPSFFDPRRHRTLQGYAEDVISILNATATQRCVYVGHSLSGVAGLLVLIGVE